MKQYSKNIVISSLALLLVGGFFYFNTIKENTQFVQKKPNKLKKAQRIDGAIEFWKQIRNNEITGEIPHGAYQRASEQMSMYSRAKTSAFNINWENIGPTNMAGRVRGIMVDPDNPNRVYAGSVSGGLYRSDNSGDSWYPVHVPEENSNHAITWIAKDPITKTYYYSTGEFRFDVTAGSGEPDASMFRGNGLYKSTDGINFEWIPSTNPNTTVTTDPWYAAYAIHKVLCHPDSAGVIYVATSRGLLRSGDAGATWTRMTVRLPVTASQVVAVPDIEYKKGDSVLYFTVRYTGSVCRLNKINYNTKQLYETNLNTTGSGRTEIALSDDKQTIYAITISNSTWDHTGVYRNVDRGNGAASAWQQIGPTASPAFDLMGPNNQGFYDVSFEVSPKQQDSTEILFAGGLDLWRWSTARGWEKISQWSIPNQYWNNPKSFGFKYEYIHADQHIVTFNPSNPNQMFVGCDGGVFRSNNRGYSFKYVPTNFVTFQFYDMDVAPDGSVLGGTQDNGCNFRTDGGNNSANKATEIVGGDGFDTYSSKKKPSTGLVSSYFGALYRFAINPATGAISAGDFYDLNIDNKTGPTADPGPDGLPDDGCGFKWDFICHEPHQYNGDSAYTIIGTTKALWITDGNTFNLGKTPKWKKMTPNSGTKAIVNASCFSIPVDADSVLYVGTTGGNVYRIKYFYSGDSVKISNSITRIFNASGRYITGLAANPKNPQELYITLGSWQSGSSAAYVVKITDAATRATVATVGSGATQLNAASGANGFPQCPAYCVEVNRYNTQQVFVGSELGVFASEDGGANWVSLNDFNGNTRPNGLPRVPVLSMKPRYYSAYTTIGANNVAQFVFTGETDYLYLGTHGRGWYKTTGKINSVGKDNPEQTQIDLNVYPNPVSDNLTLAFGIKNPANLTVQMLGLDGKVVKSMPYNAFAGNNNLQLNVMNVPTGIYLVRMTGADSKGSPINITKKVSVIH